MRHRQVKRVTLAAVLAAGVLAIGCGDDGDDANNNADDYSGQEGEVAQLVDDFANAGRDGDGDKICDEIFAEELAQNVEKEAGQSCATEVSDNLPEDDYELEVDTLEVNGDTATVSVTDQDDQKNVLHVVKNDSAWQIQSVTAG
jgi:hypothetical protein